MSTAKNNILRSNAPRVIFESAKSVVNSSTNWKQGDLLVLVSNLLKPLDEATAQGALVCGVARQTLVSGKVKSPYSTATDASEAIEDVAGPVAQVEAELVLKTGDAFAPGALVYGVDADPQTVTSVADGAAIGVYVGPNVASASAGQVGPVYVKANLA